MDELYVFESRKKASDTAHAILNMNPADIRVYVGTDGTPYLYLDKHNFTEQELWAASGIIKVAGGKACEVSKLSGLAWTEYYSGNGVKSFKGWTYKRREM